MFAISNCPLPPKGDGAQRLFVERGHGRETAKPDARQGRGKLLCRQRGKCGGGGRSGDWGRRVEEGGKVVAEKLCRESGDI